MTSSTPTKTPATQPATGNYSRFFAEVLAKLGVHGATAQADQLGLADVVVEEGRNTYFNPFNIESHGTPSESAWTGVGSVNSVGVQKYGSFQQGVDATAAYLQNNSHWQPLLDALQTGSKQQIDNAFQQVYTWGNHFSNGMNVPVQTDQNILASKLGTNSTNINTNLNTGEQIVTGIDNVAGGAVNAIDSVPKLIGWFSKPDNLIRVGFIVLGLFILLIGVDKLSGGGITGASGGGTPTETLDVVVGNKPGNSKTVAGRAASAPARSVKAATTHSERAARQTKDTATSAPKRAVDDAAKAATAE